MPVDLIQENEVVVLLSIIAIMTFAWVNRDALCELPGWRCFAASFLALFISAIATIAEAFVWEPAMNTIEHAGHMVAAILLLTWIWSVHHKHGIAV